MYFAEAFKALDCLNETTFSTSKEDLSALKKMQEDDDMYDEIEIYDTFATSRDDLSDSYVGKVILDCCTCHSLFYKSPDEIVIDEEQDVVNVDEECPICASVGGYKIIGEVAPYGKTEDDDHDEDEDDEYELLDEDASGKKFNSLERPLTEKKNQETNKDVDESSKDNDTIVLSNDFFYDLVSNIEDAGWDDVLELFKQNNWIDGKNMVIPKGTKLMKVGSDYYYNYYKVAGTRNSETFPIRAEDIYELDLDEAFLEENSKQTKVKVPRRTSKTKWVHSTRDYSMDESVKDKENRNQVNESIKDLSLTTDDTKLEMTSDETGKVTVTTEPVEISDEAEEVVAPVSNDTLKEIESNNEEVENDSDEEIEIDLDDIDEESFDSVSESLLKESFDNVNSFRSLNAKEQDGKLFVEGVVGFTSGKKGKTTFVFEGFTATKDNNVVFKGFNKQLHESGSSLELHGKVEGTKLIAESLVLK